MKINSALLALICLISGARQAHAGSCGLSLSLSNASVVWNTSFSLQQWNVTITGAKNKACSFFISFSRGGASDYKRRMASGASVLRYQLFHESSMVNVLKDLPDIVSDGETIAGFFSGAAGSPTSQTLTFYFHIPLDHATIPQLKPAGTYSDSVVVKAYSGTWNGPNELETSASLNLVATVPKNLQISLVPTSGSFDPNCTTQTIDFGTLSQGASRGFDLRVMTNAGYTVSFSSQNNGVMRHANPSISTTVPYSLSVNGVTQNLSHSATSPINVTNLSGQTSLQGAANPVSVTIGDVSSKMAGSYSDNIIVTAVTTE